MTESENLVESNKSLLTKIMETLERVRSGGRMPLLILGEAGRWKRFRSEENLREASLGEVGGCERLGEDECSGVSRENQETQSAWVTDEKTGELDMRTVESQKDQHGHPWLKPEYSKAPTRITSKTASPKIFSGRRAVTSGLFAQLTV